MSSCGELALIKLRRGFTLQIMQISSGLEERLIKQRRDAEEGDARRRASVLKLPYRDLISTKVTSEVKALKTVPEEIARAAQIAPLALSSKNLLLASFDPTKAKAKEIIEKLGKDFKVSSVVTSRRGLEYVWEMYKYVSADVGDISGKVDIDETRLVTIQKDVHKLEDVATLLRSFTSPLLSQLLEIILAGSLSLKASDIHFEPTAEKGILRFRIDGLLHTVFSEMSMKTYNSIATRIKLLSNLKINVKDEPQDGRFTIGLSDRNIEIRTSIIPSEYGETIVLRLLDPTAISVALETLGWRLDDLEIVKKMIRQPNGLILNTGPTGSGKTTTLYAFLKHIFRPEIKVITVEDPIEYHLEGISQTQVDHDAGYTFASGLRSILRQDPNVILVGEIRDRETAEIAMNASLTGHIVFSTLHTNDAIGAVPRLLDLGARPQILGPALRLVIAQRLVRVLCPHCKQEITVGPQLKNTLETFLKELPERVDKTLYEKPKIFKPKGCDRCGNLGYRGRTSVFELFSVDGEIEQTIYSDPTELTLSRLAKTRGMTTMQEDGVLKVLLGVTSWEEVERVTGTIPWKGRRKDDVG